MPSYARQSERAYLLCAWVLSLGFVAVGAARRLPCAPPDAEQYAIVARSLLRGEGYTENLVPFHAGTYASVRHVPEFHGLLRPLVLVPLFALLGEGPLALHLPNLIYAALTAMVVFWWGSRVFGPATALLASALTLLSVRLLVIGLLATDDVGFAFFATLTLAVLHRALDERRDAHFLLAGLAGGLALLEKPSGFFLAAVIAPTVWRFGGSTLGERVRRLGLVFFPFLMATGVYLARNYLAYGSPQFRFGVLVWTYKLEGYEGWNRLFDRAPSLAGQLADIGWRGVVAIVSHEFRGFLLAVSPAKSPWTSPRTVMPALFLLGVLLYRRRLPAMVWLSLGSVAAGAAFICGLWHFQPRYFTFQLPLFALWTAGLLARGLRSPARGWRGGLVRCGAAAVTLWLVASSAAKFAVVAIEAQDVPDLCTCRPAIEWIAESTRPGDRIMTFDPWSLAWIADREAIMIPSGGAEAIAVVARRYDAHWLLAYRTALRPATSKAVMAMESGAAGLVLTRQFDDATCRVLRLDWPAVPRAVSPTGLDSAYSPRL